MRGRIPPEQWERIEALFEAARVLPSDERPGFVRARSDGDPLVEAEVLALLAVASRGFDPGPVVAAAAAAAGVDEPPVPVRRIGPFRIEAPIGRGGMGIVYRGVRDSGDFQQQVAIKVLPAALGTGDLLRRFSLERRILAALEHPGIARLVDGGATEDGLPWVAMEYVDGFPITGWVERERLPLEERVRLLIAVAEAVQFAHRNLVVHRDLKPSNILVGRDGKPKLIDFGIAKLLEGDDPGAPATEVGMRLLTPAYASPEQLRGDPVTTATDVWSLGAVGYELMTGHRPFDGEPSGPRSVEHAILTDDPIRPTTTAGRRLPPDLATILLAALRKEPDRRYGSAEAFADDLKRFLDGRPIRARPATFRYRTARFVGRNRWAVAATVAVAGLLAAGGWRLAQEQRRAERERAAAEAALAFMDQLFQQGDPRRSVGGSATVREVLDRGLAQVEREERDPVVTARLLASIGSAYEGVGQPDTSETVLRRAVGLARDAGDRRTLVLSLGGLGRLLNGLGRYPEAADLGAQAVAAADRLGDPELLRRALMLLGTAVGNLRRADSAERVIDRVMALAATRGDTVQVLTARSVIASIRGQGETAQTLLREAWRLVAADSSRDPFAAAQYAQSVSGGFRARGNQPDSQLFYQRLAVDLSRRSLPPGHPWLIDPLRGLGLALLQAGHLPQADSALAEGTRIADSAVGRWSVDAANMRVMNGIADRFNGRDDASLLAFEQAVAIFDSVLGPTALQLAPPLSNLGVLYEMRGRYAEAERVLVRSMEIQRAANASKGEEALALNAIGLVQRRQGKFALAEATLRRSAALLDRDEGRRPMKRWPLEHLGGLYVDTGRDSLAVAAFNEAIGFVGGADSAALRDLGERFRKVLLRRGQRDSAARVAAWIEARVDSARAQR
ncbi:MAG: serine/threonine-protein kinase [Gemmatimonadales bacterium]